MTKKRLFFGTIGLSEKSGQKDAKKTNIEKIWH